MKTFTLLFMVLITSNIALSGETAFSGKCRSLGGEAVFGSECTMELDWNDDIDDDRATDLANQLDDACFEASGQHPKYKLRISYKKDFIRKSHYGNWFCYISIE